MIRVTNHGRTQRAMAQIERCGSDFFDTGTMAPTSPVFGFMGFLVLLCPLS